jgi:hypothetical protein
VVGTNSDLVEQPLFLVGSERSGTTLLRLMLDHHPRIAFLFEFEYSVRFIPDEGWPDLHEYHAFLESIYFSEETNMIIDKSLDYPHLIDSFLRQKRERDGKPLVGATVHYDFDRLLRIWPDARFIHLVRDGRDVARSIIEMGWAGNMYTAVDRWIDAEQLWSRVSQVVPSSRRIELQFEALVSEPEATLTKLCEFIGVSYDPAMLDYTKSTKFDPPSTKSIGQWKRKLSPKEVCLAEARIGTMLADRGYESSGYPPLTVTPLMARWLRIQDRWYRAMFRRRRYGIGLFLADFLTRRFDLTRTFRPRIERRLFEVHRIVRK